VSRGTMSEVWYFVDSDRAVGPLTLHELTERLGKVPHWTDVLVWRLGVSEWERAENFSELKMRMAIPPPVPKASAAPMPAWGVRWWWYPVALFFLGSIGNSYGRKTMAWLTSERQAARMTKRKRRRHDPN
jgi:GYF domain 2